MDLTKYGFRVEARAPASERDPHRLLKDKKAVLAMMKKSFEGLFTIKGAQEVFEHGHIACWDVVTNKGNVRVVFEREEDSDPEDDEVHCVVYRGHEPINNGPVSYIDKKQIVVEWWGDEDEDFD